MKYNVFVASTLPIGFIDKIGKESDVKAVYLINDNHLGAYKYLQKNNPSIRLICLPMGFIKHFVSLLGILISIKIRKEKIIFFHECCWEVFDVILNILNIPADYYPHVTLNSLKRLECADIPFANKIKLFLMILNQLSRFKPYELTTDACTKGIVWSCEYYPEKTHVHNLAEVWAVRDKSEARLLTVDTQNILFVVGTELVEDGSLLQLYERIGKMLANRGYKLYIKDHPNHESRLNIEAGSWAQTIDPNCPVEFLEQDFLCAIGCASTGLASFKGKAISIIHMIEIELDILQSRLEHLNALFREREIKYPQSEQMLLSLVDEFRINRASCG
jgi:hypothetical protein